MKKLSLIVFYQCGSELASLREITSTESVASVWGNLAKAELWLMRFLMESRELPFTKSRVAAQNLLGLITKIETQMLEQGSQEKMPSVQDIDKEILLTALGRFEKELEHDSRELNVFSVEDKGTHSATKLLEDAALNLPSDIRVRLTGESLEDIKAAGRCLAFDTPTASAFHILRGVEPLILQYRNALLGTSVKLKSRNWGAYIRELATHGADARVVGMLNHIKDFYRNPIMHPEETLTSDQALSLFHACLSAIVQLDAAIRALTPLSGTGSAP